MIDYLIVGSGLAGISFAEQALNNNKSIFVIDSYITNSSKIAAGLYNPVILKRFSALWQAQEHLNIMKEFYDRVQKKLHCQFDYKLPILRKFFSIEEQNNWFMASDKLGLSPFLSLKLLSVKYNGIDSPFGFGEVKQTGYVDVALLLSKYKEYLLGNELFLDEIFDYSAIRIHENCVQYKTLKVKHIIFAEGFGMHSNPFFNHLPLDGTKGELLVIKSPDLDLDVIINTNLFILPLGDGFFKVGATYNWKDKTNIPTEDGKQELILRLKEIITTDFEIISHLAGVRPTVKDRKPLIGTHTDYKNIHILNGLGTRGVMLGPAMAKALYDLIEFGTPLTSSIDISRFKSTY